MHNEGQGGPVDRKPIGPLHIPDGTKFSRGIHGEATEEPVAGSKHPSPQVARITRIESSSTEPGRSSERPRTFLRNIVIQAFSMPQTHQCSALFVYGSLRFDGIAELVGGGPFVAQPCVLYGHRRRRVRGRPWPGIRPDPEEQTDGLILRDVSPDQIEIFDLFEGDAYQRQIVRVQMSAPEKGAADAFAYVIRGELTHWMTNELWDQEWFEKNILEDFTQRCRIFRSEIDRGL